MWPRILNFTGTRKTESTLQRIRSRPQSSSTCFTNNAIDLGYELTDHEERYRAVGLTSAGRLLTVVWTPRSGSIRAATAFPATVSDKKAFLEMSR
jgi:uncharacterized DUF497 family protein